MRSILIGVLAGAVGLLGVRWFMTRTIGNAVDAIVQGAYDAYYRQ